MPRRSSRGLIAAGVLALAAVVLAGAYLGVGRPVDSNYFGPNEPTWVRVPTTLGDPVYVGVLLLRAQPGHAIELHSLVVEGLVGDTAVEPMVRILDGETRTLGGIALSDLGDTIDPSTYGRLELERFAAEDGPVELAVRVTGTTPVHGFDGLWLQFNLNGARATTHDWIPLRVSICTGTTRFEAIERCRPIEAEMHDKGP